MSIPTRERRISSVKYIESKSEITIEYQNYNDVSHSWDNLTINSTEKPSPEFVDSIGALSESIAALLAWPDFWAKEITVTGFKRKLDAHDNVSVVLKGYRTLPDNTRPHVLNTPLTAIVGDKDTGELPMHLARLEELLNAAVTEAKGFLDGRRGQMNLPFGEGGPGESEQPVPVGDEVPGEGFVDIDPAAAKPKKPAKRKPARTAKGKGEQAREDNQEMSANPYNMKDNPDAYASWNLGWQEKDEGLRREAEAAATGATGDEEVPFGDEYGDEPNPTAN